MNKLYFVPYAGGSSVTFKMWKSILKPEIDFRIFELAGHGKRIFDDCYNSMQEACEDLYNTLKNNVSTDEVYFLSGHCMGAIIAYETCKLIKDRGEIPLPHRLFLSGHGAPIYIHNEKNIKDRDKEGLVQFLIDEGGTTEEYLDDELLELILPAIKSDAKIYEEYEYHEDTDLSSIPLTILYGTNDKKTPMNEVKAWDKFSNSIEYVEFNSDHYFINSCYEKYLDIIKNRIEADIHE